MNKNSHSDIDIDILTSYYIINIVNIKRLWIWISSFFFFKTTLVPFKRAKVYDLQLHLQKSEYNWKVHFISEINSRKETVVYSRFITYEVKCFRPFSVLILMITAHENQKSSFSTYQNRSKTGFMTQKCRPSENDVHSHDQNLFSAPFGCITAAWRRHQAHTHVTGGSGAVVFCWERNPPPPDVTNSIKVFRLKQNSSWIVLFFIRMFDVCFSF